MSTGTVVACACGVAATAFLGYCVYFDRKRRSDPNYKQKIRERRRRADLERNRGSGARVRPGNMQEMQQYFFNEVQRAEELMAQGDFDRAVEHLLNAVAVCNNPQKVLEALSQTLPPEVFQMLVQKLPSILDQAAPMADEDADGLD